MTRLLFSLALLVLASNASASSSTSRLAAWGIPRGGSESTYSTQLETVKTSVLEAATDAIEDLRRKIVIESKIVSDFGAEADTICNKALEDFAKSAPDASDAAGASEYDRKLEQLEAALDAPLQVLYLRQLALLREQALSKYRVASKTTGASDYEAMLQADGQFTAAAEDATREGSDWDYSSERSYLQSVMTSVAESGKRATDIQLKSAQQHQTAMQFLQQQQQMIQQLQMQLYGQTSPWNIGVAYRIPDTNFNLQGSYQQGRGNIQLSCVPDEYAPFLGPNGFTNGVGPGNLGLSLNLSV
ncbi:unnamed protein product [Cylindrotheca closterium]|uniref:Chorismate mutase n=1 Tax=Cylindrotheca closterium TaxID=2856 RepID=A0AAD2GAM3_9STRA|nr:unnamed protein product [Cylindrotheca closterium]